MTLMRWGRLFLPLAAVMVAVFYGYGRLEADRELEMLVVREQTALGLAAERLAQTLEDTVADARLIADTPAVRDFLRAPDAEHQERVEQLFASFIRAKSHNSQLRLLDAKGFEMVRVYRATEGARAAPAVELQDNGARDYFSETCTLPPGRVRVSRFDLNIENGQIERPPNPVLRLSMRLNPDAPNPDRVLVVNLRGAVILKVIEEVLRSHEREAWLLDREGFWLMHPNPAMEWGEQLDHTRRLALVEPQLAPLQDQDRGVRRLPDALYVHRRLDALTGLAASGVVDAAPRFVLVSRVAADQLPRVLPASRIWPQLVLLLIAALGCAALARTRTRAATAEQRERDLLASQAAANAENLWVREHIYQLSLKIHAASDPASFANAVLVELASVLGLAAACLYALREGRAEPMAGFGLPEASATREFGPGEGLVGEAARTRTERRMTPPPAGYLDLVGGAGAGPAADLRVLPLWVHSRSVGVIELAFAGIPSARQEEFLRQVLPLLALNLEGFVHASRRTA